MELLYLRNGPLLSYVATKYGLCFCHIHIKERERGGVCLNKDRMGAPTNVYLIQEKYINNTTISIPRVTPYWETGFLKYKLLYVLGWGNVWPDISLLISGVHYCQK